MTKSFLKSSILLLFLSIIAHPVHAETLQYVEEGDVATIRSLETLFTNTISIVVSFVGVALFVVLIIAGFSYLTAGGDAKRLERAKGSLTGALVGLILIVLAYLIIHFISIFTGIDTIEQFNVNVSPGTQ